MLRFKKRILTVLILAAFTASSTAAERPRVVINIIAGSMQAEALEHYAHNMGQGGFARLMARGAVFTDAHYGWMQTTTPPSLATLATGATPATHGIVASRWYDYTQQRFTDVVADDKTKIVGAGDRRGGYSPQNMVAPTLTDMLVRSDRMSRAITIAIRPSSAIITAGSSGHCFWLDCEKCRWTTSTAYAENLPAWVDEYNSQDMKIRFLDSEWVCSHVQERYLNKYAAGAAVFAQQAGGKKRNTATAAAKSEKILATPAGNSIVFDFAKYALTAMHLGADTHTDIINIYLDAPDEIAARYGCESVEYEDMLYRLDNEIKEFLNYLSVHMRYSETALVVFTSAHGTAPCPPTAAQQADRFVPRQFELIVNAYLSARYGQGQWVLGYQDRSLYLNRSLIRDKRMSLEEVQSEVASFAMQFRGVAHAVTAAALQSSYFADGYAAKIQRGFYPRRSGDVIINLFPERTAADDGYRSESGSMYSYDTHVPLIFYGAGTAAKRYDMPTDMTCVAPTLARIMQIAAPAAAEGRALNIE